MKHNRAWLALSLALMLLSAVVASQVQTAGGAVALKDMRWETHSGKTISALLYKPASATAQHPAPAIVDAHGWWNNREMQGPSCVELARRGYVVVSVDMYGHGNSDSLDISDVSQGGTGMYDAVKLVADLPYVDKRRIGVSGHSHGARAANFSVEIDNKADKPLIAAVLLVDSDPIYTDSHGKYSNIYGSRDVGLIADQYDEFYFSSYSPEGSLLTTPSQFIETSSAQSFLHFGIDPHRIKDHRVAGRFYADNRALRITYTPPETHPWGSISKTTISNQIAFFEQAFRAPDPILPAMQIWPYKEAATAVGLVGFCMFLVTFTQALLKWPIFAELRDQAPRPLASANRAGMAWFWAGMVISVLVFAMTYVIMGNVRSITNMALNNTPSRFVQGAVFFVALWHAINGLTGLVIMKTSHRLAQQKTPMDPHATGSLPGWRRLFRTLWLAFVVVAAAYGIVFLLDYFFKTDFRLWLIAVKAFTPDKLRIALLYLPFFAVYFIANSVVINSFNQASLTGREWLDTVALALANTLAPLMLVAAGYATLFVTGRMLPGVRPIFVIWLFPVIGYLAVSTIISRKLYRTTHNPYLGGFINAAVVTMIAVTNTLTVAS